MAERTRAATPSHAMRISLNLYRSRQERCAYLPAKAATTLFIDPDSPLDTLTYSHLLAQGFRRSGDYVYRPHCDSCRACIPLRLPVARFRPSRSQRRVWAKSSERLSVRTSPPRFHHEHFELYRRYIQSRHPDGSMANPSAEDFPGFLTSHWSETRFFELRVAQRLTAVAVTDLLPNGLSAVYTFFDPELSHLSPGVLALLWQIREAQRRGVSWLYLGYWVPGCAKMSYKSHYRPMQIWRDGQWQTFDRNEEILLPE